MAKELAKLNSGPKPASSKPNFGGISSKKPGGSKPFGMFPKNKIKMAGDSNAPATTSAQPSMPMNPSMGAGSNQNQLSAPTNPTSAANTSATESPLR